MPPLDWSREFRFLARLLVVTCLCQQVALAELTADAVHKLTPQEIEQRLPNEHPSVYYFYAGRLWSEGRSDDAVFWFYAGQLRYRFHLRANPKLDPSGEVQATYFLHLNVDAELVVRRRTVTSGTYPNKPRPVRLENTFWNRAKRLAESEPPPPVPKP